MYSSTFLHFTTDSGRGPSPLYVQLPNDPIYNNAVPNITTNPMYTHRSTSTPPIQPPPPIPPPPSTTHPSTTTNAVGGMNEELALTLAQSDRIPMEINKQWLKMMEKIGEGQFGEVHHKQRTQHLNK